MAATGDPQSASLTQLGNCTAKSCIKKSCNSYWLVQCNVSLATNTCPIFSCSDSPERLQGIWQIPKVCVVVAIRTIACRSKQFFEGNCKTYHDHCKSACDIDDPWHGSPVTHFDQYPRLLRRSKLMYSLYRPK